MNKDDIKVTLCGHPNGKIELILSTDTYSAASGPVDSTEQAWKELAKATFYVWVEACQFNKGEDLD